MPATAKTTASARRTAGRESKFFIPCLLCFLGRPPLPEHLGSLPDTGLSGHQCENRFQDYLSATRLRKYTGGCNHFSIGIFSIGISLTAPHVVRVLTSSWGFQTVRRSGATTSSIS